MPLPTTDGQPVPETAEVLTHIPPLGVVSRAVAEPRSHVERGRPLNDVPALNDHLRAVNARLGIGDRYVVWVETHHQRAARLTRRVPAPLRWAIKLGDFLVFRALPKLPITGWVHDQLRGDHPPVLSLTEVLGRLVFCGFSIVRYDEDGGLTRITAEKEAAARSGPAPTRGVIVRLQRSGRAGLPIRLYKLRTMHPYAEHVQAFAQERNGFSNGDKIRDDFRVTRWGRFLRQHFLDELPMIFNLLRGDLKLVGVRPLSQHKLLCYAPELQVYRSRFTPGLFPPFYVDLPDDLDGMQESEWRYLRSYERAPLRTDATYLLKALANIVLRGARSE